jgi:hypothetical protein
MRKSQTIAMQKVVGSSPISRSPARLSIPMARTSGRARGSSASSVSERRERAFLRRMNPV